jgi:replication factor C large subunit
VPEATSWTEKHRPTSLDEVEGNPSAVDELRAWADSWGDGRPDEPAVALVGEPGIGKTSAAHALARERDWSVIELNASDARNKDAIQEVATRGAVSQGFSETGEYQRSRDRRKLIILDEADNVFGNEDRGGMQQIARTLEETQHPVVLIANDAYELSDSSSTVDRLAKEVEFQSVRASTIRSILERICRAEGVDAEPGALEALAEHAAGDVRAAVSDLEALARDDRRLTVDDVDALGYRDESETIFNALTEILQADDFGSAREASFDLDEDPETLLLWVEENAPREYDDPGDRARAMDVVARADELLGVTQRTRNYRFWSYVSDLVTGGVATAKRSRYSGWTRYRFPSWLRKMGRSKAKRRRRDALAGKVAKHLHAGPATAREHLFPMLSFVAHRSDTFAAHLAADLGLDDSDLALLLDTRKNAKQVSSILEEAERLNAERGQTQAEGVELDVPGADRSGGSEPAGEAADDDPEAAEDDAEEEPAPEDDEEQANLFEF